MNAEYTGQQIAQLRKEKGLTQKALADQLHVTDKAVSKWERGLNFPDLGLIEHLAKTLDTTPSYLLGLEDASKEEIVNSFTELSGQQAEHTYKDMQKIGWLNLFATVFLTIFLSLINIKLQRNGLFYESELLLWGLYILINTILIGSIYTLRKYKAIKKLETLDFVLIEGLIAVLAVHFGIQLVTGHLPNVFFAYSFAWHWFSMCTAFLLSYAKTKDCESDSYFINSSLGRLGCAFMFCFFIVS